MPKYLFTLFAFVYLAVASAQPVNIGVPPIWNFSKKHYKAGTQNWDAAQDSRGVMYWANNEGLLQFNGVQWSCAPVSNSTIVRSVAIDSKDRIFVGAQSEFGYFTPNIQGSLVYHSLVNLLPKKQLGFEDVWDIVFWNDEVFFRTNNTVYQYANNRIQVHALGDGLTFMCATKAGVLIQKGAGLFVFKNDAFVPYMDILGMQSNITGCVPWQGDTILLPTLKNGVFYVAGNDSGPWTTSNDALLKEARIYSATALDGQQIALGTSLAGLVVLDKQRRVFRHLTKKEGLQNNNVLNAFGDRSGNVWLGLDNGIDCVVLDALFTSLFPDEELEGTGYAAAVHDNTLYLGVSNGVYKTPWQNFYSPTSANRFTKLQGSDGQVWSLNTIDNQLLLGHHEGAFTVGANAVSNISEINGAWTFVQLSEDVMLGGTYTGLTLYRKTAKGWVFDRKLDGINESCRVMVKDANNLVWVSHPYRGVFSVKWVPDGNGQIDVKFFNSKNGLPSDLNNYVFSIAGKPVFATTKGVYRFNTTTQRFMVDQDFEKALGGVKHVKYLKQDNFGKIWYKADDEVGVILVDDNGLRKDIKKQIYPELSTKLVGGFEYICPIDEHNVLFGVEEGFLLFNDANVSKDTLLNVFFSNITLSGGQRDSTLHNGWFVSKTGQLLQAQEENNIPVLPAIMNNIRFEFAATDFKHPSFVQYRSQLKGIEADWSAWNSETKKAYLNLAPGTYTFLVQARMGNGVESKVCQYTFTIMPHWYKSKIAFFFYFLALLGLIGRFFFKQKSKFESEKAELTENYQIKEEEHQRKVEESKALIDEIQTEKLEAEIRFKNQELASATMHLVQKGEILIKVQDDLRSIYEKQTNAAVKKEIQQLINLLNSDRQLDNDWEQFAYHFDQVHIDFLQRLRVQHPQLSVADHKLCAYLHLNLSTKEIAPLMNISVRGVEASRYRLRKKLGLSNEANLTDFLNQV